MIRTETFSLTAAPLLVVSDVYGFQVDTKTATAPYRATVLAAGDDGRQGERDIIVQEGRWYHCEAGWNLVKLSTVDGAKADVYVTYATRREDRAGEQGADVAGRSRVLFDSGVVAGGALIDSPVLDLSATRDLEVIVDNTLGTTFRDLSLSSYLDDGATLIDQLILRRVAWGAKANGADYDPGRVRGLIGPRPPGFISGAHVLYDQTSPANAPLSTGPLVVEDEDEVEARVLFSAGVAAGISLSMSSLADDGTTISQGYVSAAAGNGGIGIARGVGLGPGSANGGSALAESVAEAMPVLRRLKADIQAAGVGITGRLILLGRGRPPGTFSIPMTLPTRAKLTLAAGGNQAARLVVVGR